MIVEAILRRGIAAVVHPEDDLARGGGNGIDAVLGVGEAGDARRVRVGPVTIARIVRVDEACDVRHEMPGNRFERSWGR